MSTVTANYKRVFGYVERVATEPKDADALGKIRDGFAGKVGQRDVYDAIIGYISQQRDKVGFSADALIQTIAEAVAPTHPKNFADGVAARFTQLQAKQVSGSDFRALTGAQSAAEAVGYRALAMPIVADGLNYPFSPNHLKTSVEVATYQVDIIAKLEAGDYEGVFESIRNDAATGANVFAKADIEKFFKPLGERLPPAGWKILQLLGVFHDIARVETSWATDNALNLKNVAGIVHDFEAVHLLRNNPQILDQFDLANDEREMLISLIEWHTIPGQNVFGEGNTSGWRRVLEMSIERGDTTALDIARLHGLIDVMSATAPDLNGTQVSRFGKGILGGHVALAKQVDDAWSRRAEHTEHKNILLTVYRENAAKETSPELTEVGKRFGLSVSSMFRLAKLTGVKDPMVMTNGLEKLDKSFLEAFEKATDTEDTWYATYLPWNLGSNFIQRTGMPADDVIAGLVKVVSASAAYHGADYKGRFGFTTRNLARENPVVLIKTLSDLKTLDGALELFSANAKRNEGLTLTRSLDGVEFVRLFPGGTLSSGRIAALRASNVRDAVMSRLGGSVDMTGSKLAQRLGALMKASPDFTNNGHYWPISALSRTANLFNTLDVTRLNEFPGISPNTAVAIAAYRGMHGHPFREVFGCIADLTKIVDVRGTPLISPEAIEALETQEKLAQICSANFVGSVELGVSFFKSLEQHLQEPGADEVSFLQHIKNTVATRPMEFRMQGEIVAMNEGSLSRTIDPWPMYNIHFTQTLKDDLTRDFGIVDWPGFKAALDHNPMLLKQIVEKDGRVRTDVLTGKVSGSNNYGWWAPLADLNRLGTAAEIARDRGLPIDTYGSGFLMVQMPYETAGNYEIRKPTPYDAVGLREWVPVPDQEELQAQGAKLGKTAGGVGEVIIRGVPIAGLNVRVVYGTK